MSLADLPSIQVQPAQAFGLLSEALPLLEKCNQPISVAHLKTVLAQNLRNQGQLDGAVKWFRAACGDYDELRMSGFVVYLRILMAETLIALSRHREAEWEILAALPTIEEQKMVPEGFAAVALLKESVRRRQVDPKALRELGEHLTAKP